ncbi:MAG TPA: NAD(P)H-dependent glycerol-3-phosphate dehydrogenase [Gemmatimonadaceae bacterium]|nr:NAD(P)H-dependent glycerol-3-phosphate dehydrogenase [Gemmatimonadaceae bacterium]
MTRCAVLGAGAWGTALADLLARNGEDVTLWALEPDVVASINTSHENRVFLAGAPLSERLRATADLGQALADAEVICLVTPSQHLRDVLRRAAPSVRKGAILCVASKGIETGTLALMSDVVSDAVPGHAVVALSGPSFAAEVAARQPTAIVAASADERAAESVQAAFSNSTFRVYTHDDIIGVELGGSLKNVMAVATGICEGAGFGFNARAALVTRGLAEMTRLGTALGAKAATFAGLAGIGDLVLTCTGSLSRNRAVGMEVGAGATLEQALAGKQTVAEGVATTRSALALATREGVEMPIVTMVNRVLFDRHPAHRAVQDLMSRELRAEQDT